MGFMNGQLKNAQDSGQIFSRSEKGFYFEEKNRKLKIEHTNFLEKTLSLHLIGPIVESAPRIHVIEGFAKLAN